MDNSFFTSKRGLYVLTALGIGFVLAFVVFFIHRGVTDYQTATDFIGNIQMNTIEQFQRTFGLTMYSELALYYAASQAIHLSAQDGGRGMSTMYCDTYRGKMVLNAPGNDCMPSEETMAQGLQEHTKSVLQYYFSEFKDLVIPLYALSEPLLTPQEQSLHIKTHFRQPIELPILITEDTLLQEAYTNQAIYHQTVDLYRVGDIVWPLRSSLLDNFVITSLFGKRTIDASAYPDHHGVDIRAQAGEPVYAIANGTVEEVVRWDEGHALGSLRLSHANNLESRYLHCTDILVNRSQQVEQGQPLCFVGGAGAGRLGEFAPHLHFEIRQNGILQDPLLFYLPLELYFTQSVLYQIESPGQDYRYEEQIRRSII